MVLMFFIVLFIFAIIIIIFVHRYIYAYGSHAITGWPPSTISTIQAVAGILAGREDPPRFLGRYQVEVLNLRTEHEEIERRCIGKLLKRRIERHLKLLYARVPTRPTLTWEMTHDLHLRPETVLITGLEKLGAKPSIIFQIYIMQYLSLLLCRE